MHIEVENLGKRFKREWIFKNLTATFQVGNVYAIVGPNGCGKSTLLQTLWGQMLPSAGELHYVRNDQRIPAEDWFRCMAIATPYMDLIDEFTLDEMIEFHFKFKPLAVGFRKGELIDQMELAHARTKFISQFSSGMKQRLKLALAFYSRAEVLFLDEPTTNLDKNATAWYLDQLARTSASLIFIASNQAHEYPENAVKINIMDHK